MKLKRFTAAAICAALAVSLFAVPVSALEKGAYTAPCNTYYRNPDTGAIDDGGTKDESLGEGMCRSAIYETALIESDGQNTYITVRMQLMSNIRNIKFSVQQTAGDPNSYKSVSYDTTQEDASADTADMRFQVPKADSYIRCDMYVIPMGRDVVYYINASADEATAGLEDFVATVSTENTSGSSADKFADLQGHWAKDAVAAVVDRGLFAGTSDTAFSPESSMTRAMFVTVMGRLSGVDTPRYTSSDFSDVNADSWYGSYVTWAAENHIVNGVGSGLFAPDKAITQQELAVMLMRYAEFAGIDLSESGAGSLVNASQTASWAAEAVGTLAKAGMITDSDGGDFCPDQPAARAQVASVLSRFMKAVN